MVTEAKEYGQKKKKKKRQKRGNMWSGQITVSSIGMVNCNMVRYTPLLQRMWRWSLSSGWFRMIRQILFFPLKP